jgi:neutral trehalase
MDNVNPAKRYHPQKQFPVAASGLLRVPGGRFREIYYWDSYFTMQGLAVSNRYDLIEDMLDNFKYLIDTYGHIPNGNRNYT